jgi:hypothetical protein
MGKCVLEFLFVFIYLPEFLATDSEARVDSRHYQFFRQKKKKGKQVVGLERGSLSLVSTTEELLDRKVAAPV